MNCEKGIPLGEVGRKFSALCDKSFSDNFRKVNKETVEMLLLWGCK